MRRRRRREPSPRPLSRHSASKTDASGPQAGEGIAFTAATPRWPTHIRATHAVRLGLRQIVGASEEEMRAPRRAPRRGLRFRARSLARAAVSRPPRWKSSPTPTLFARSASTGARRFGRCAALDRVGDQDDLPLFAASRPERDAEPDAKLPPMPLGAHVVEDYRRLSLSLKAHPTVVHAHASRRARHLALGRARLCEERRARDGRRPGAGAPAAGHRQGRHLHDAGGRGGRRQCHRLAEGVRTLARASSSARASSP